ncbi:hypothetical protein MMC07_000014 [Pseudocyphellaria aurata]|nr:hypothetical protein [Pseudocyphellaria aurata]
MSSEAVHADVAHLPSLPSYDKWLHDSTFAAQRWEADSGLYVAPPSVLLIMRETESSLDRVYEDEETLTEGLNCRHAQTRLILIQPAFSWGKLLVTRSCMALIVKHLSPLPTLIDLLHTFGARNKPLNESAGGFGCSQDNDGQSSEICYLLKCVEENKRGHVDHPWSIRHFIVYERYEVNENSSDFLLINPYATRMLTEKLIQLRDETANLPSRTKLHLTMLSACTSNWTAYVSWLEAQLYPLTTKAFVSRDATRDGSSDQSGMPLEPADMQLLQITQEKLIQAQHLLELNHMTFAALRDCFRAVEQTENSTMKTTLETQHLHHLIVRIELEAKRVVSLLTRATAAGNLMQNLISSRSLQTLYESSNTGAKIAQLAQEDNRIMLALSREGRRDGRTLKTITVLTLAYLPASFVSTLLSMGYISVQNTDGHISLRFQAEIVVFAVLTAIFLAITFGLWLTLDLLKSRREDALNGIKHVDFEKARSP